MHYLSKWFYGQGAAPNAQALIDAIEDHVKSVQTALAQRVGVNPTAVLGHVAAAQEDLLRLAPLSYVRGQLPSLVEYSQSVLRDEDLQLIALKALASKAASSGITDDDRETVVSCLRGTNQQIRRTQSRLQSFRTVILTTAAFLMFLALATGIVGFVNPNTIPLCFVAGERGQAVTVVACPASQSSPFLPLFADPIEPQFAIPIPALDTSEVFERTTRPWDVALVEFVGFIAATLAAAFSIRNIRGSADPYSIPVALACLKLPAGALTAVLGLMLIRAGLVPGIESLGSSAEIIAWALVFGYAQQLFTGVVDRQASSVLEESGASPPSTQTGATSR